MHESECIDHDQLINSLVLDDAAVFIYFTRMLIFNSETLKISGPLLVFKSPSGSDRPTGIP